MQLRKFDDGETRLAVPRSKILRNIRTNLKKDIPWIRPEPAHELELAIAAFGPSLKTTWRKLGTWKHVWALNGAHDFLIEKGLVPSHAYFMCPGERLNFYLKEPHPDVTYIVASQVEPAFLDRLKGHKVFLFHAWQGGHRKDNVIYWGHPSEKWWTEAINKLGLFPEMNDGFSHAGLRAIVRAYWQGYRVAHLFGLDASIEEKEYHPGEDIDTNKHEIIDIVTPDGRAFKSLRGYVSQVEQMATLRNALPDMEIVMYGDGLMQHYFKLEKQDNNVSVTQP